MPVPTCTMTVFCRNHLALAQWQEIQHVYLKVALYPLTFRDGLVLAMVLWATAARMYKIAMTTPLFQAVLHVHVPQYSQQPACRLKANYHNPGCTVVMQVLYVGTAWSNLTQEISLIFFIVSMYGAINDPHQKNVHFSKFFHAF